MPRYRRPSLGVLGSLRSGLRTYNAALYAGRATADTARKIKTWYQNRKKAPQNPIVAKIRQRTRGELASHPTAFSRGTISGQQRRDARAKLVVAHRAKYPVKRSRTGDVNAIKPVGYKGPSSLKQQKGAQHYPPSRVQIFEGMSDERLQQRIGQKKRREFIGTVLHQQGTRKAAADFIRSMRKAGLKQRFHPNSSLTSPGSYVGSSTYGKAREVYKKNFGHYPKKTTTHRRKNFTPYD